MRILFLCIFLFAPLASAKKHPKPQPPPSCSGPQSVSLQASNWLRSGSFFGSSQQPSPLPGGGFFFMLPDRSTGRFEGYVMTDLRCGIAGSRFLTVTMRVLTTGAPVFRYDSESFNTCSFPASARPYFKSGTNEFDRWWSNPQTFVLASGTITLTIQLTPEAWSSVQGKFGNFNSQSASGFNNALRDTKQIGITFGGGCFFGHGVAVSGGTAQFQMLSYSTF